MMPENMSDILSDHRRFFNSGKTRAVPFRIEQLKTLKAAIRAYEDEIIQALHEDLRKPPFEGYAGEIGVLYSEIGHAIRHVTAWARPRGVSTPIIHFPSSSRIYQDPYGVTLIIGPWNYPFQLIMAPLVGAIAAGNCAVLKPSELAPAASAAIRRMVEAHFPPEYIRVIEGGVDVTRRLLEQRFDYIFFTGGTAVGRVVMEAAARHLTPVTLELGGKSPTIVEKDARLDFAVRRIAWGKFFNAGQTCLAPDYCLVHRTIKEAFLAAMEKTVRAFYGEDPSQSPDYARIVNDRHFRRIEGLLGNGRIVFGGLTLPDERYIAPTLIDQVTLRDPIMREEIFGPLFPILTYDDLDEAIAIVNGQPRPLALYFFSQDGDRQQKVLRETNSGGGCINDTLSHVASLNLPFGGVGDSGMGAYHGRSSFDAFSHRKSILKRSNLVDISLRYPPYGDKIGLLKRFFRPFG